MQNCTGKLREIAKNSDNGSCGMVTIARLKRTYSAKTTHSGVPEWQPLASSHIKLDYYTTIKYRMQHFFININVENNIIFVQYFVHFSQQTCLFAFFYTFYQKNIYICPYDLQCVHICVV